ncbi:hypothetical protein C0J52_09102 [Blattella germanica]|nr:hypothetical protein C0J52_09102 [Blattella germanica]
MIFNTLFLVLLFRRVASLPNYLAHRPEFRFPRSVYPTRETAPVPSDHVGPRLLLTPYISAGNISEARNLSKVVGQPFGHVPSYSGFLTVNEECNSNLFFWFFPAQNDYERAPIILWLQGGPGASSLFGLFEEIGPFQISKNTSFEISKNPHSFTDREEGFATNQTQIGAELYLALLQLTKTSRWFDNLAEDIFNKLPYEAHVIPYQRFKSALRKWLCWYQNMDKFKRESAYSNEYNFLRDQRQDIMKSFDNLNSFLNQNDVRRALHVGDVIFSETGFNVMMNLRGDMMQSVKTWLEELMEHYRVLYYSGQLDIIVAYAMSVRMFNALNFSAAEEYRNATRVPWYVDGELAGYIKSAGKFTEVLVRNAGHMVPADQPKWAFDLISRFIGGNLLSAAAFALKDDVGSRLILTPYIEEKMFQKARSLSAVNFGPFRDGIPSYAGFFSVNKRFNSNLFFWFFPAENDYETAPVVLWLQGGPGTSSLFGLFTELGPFSVAEDNATLLDNPYSFTDFSAGLATNQTQIGEELYSALVQFFTLFSELRSLPFFITGESYAGKYVPTLGHIIHKKNPTAKLKINLQGLAVGNGWTDPVNMMDMSSFLFQLGFIDNNIRELMHELEEETIRSIESGDFEKAYMANARHHQYYFAYTDYKDMSNFLEKDWVLHREYHVFLNKSDVRRALHVGDADFDYFSFEAFKKLRKDIMKSVKTCLEELLEHYRVLYYSGQLDIVVAYAMSVRMFNALNFSAAEEYRNARRVPWYVDGELAGYMTFVRRKDVRRALHVGDAPFQNQEYVVFEKLTLDFMQSVRPWLEELLEHYRVLYYSGQLDIIVAYALSANMYSKLDFSASEEYRNATRMPWYVDGQLAGLLNICRQQCDIFRQIINNGLDHTTIKWYQHLSHKI